MNQKQFLISKTITIHRDFKNLPKDYLKRAVYNIAACLEIDNQNVIKKAINDLEHYWEESNICLHCGE